MAVFFLGGTSSLSQSIRSIFYGSTTGTDISLAREFCAQRCDQIRESGVESGASFNPYCRKNLDVDISGDGTLDDTDRDLSCDDLVTRGVVSGCQIDGKTYSC